MEEIQELKPIIYFLTSIGLFHFKNVKTAPMLLRILSYTYATIRLILSYSLIIIFLCSIILGKYEISQMVMTVSEGILEAINTTILYSLCSMENGVFRFLAIWQKFRLTKLYHNDIYKHCWLLLIISIIVALLPTGITFHSFLTTSINQDLVDFYFGFVPDTTKATLNQLLKIFVFLVIFIFQALTYCFIPIFQMMLVVIMSNEFQEWNIVIKSTIKSPEDDHLGSLPIELQRLNYEKLCNILKHADNLVSFYLGMNLLVYLINICFLIYTFIISAVPLSAGIVYSLSGIIILAVLVVGNAIVSFKVSSY